MHVLYLDFFYLSCLRHPLSGVKHSSLFIPLSFLVVDNWPGIIPDIISVWTETAQRNQTMTTCFCSVLYWPRQVKIWFQNRRMKEKKLKRERLQYYRGYRLFWWTNEGERTLLGPNTICVLSNTVSFQQVLNALLKGNQYSIRTL